MNIGADIPVWLAKNLPYLAKNQVRPGAVVGRFRAGAHFEPDERRVCRTQDGGAQMAGGAVEEQGHVGCASCCLQPQRRPHGAIAFVRQQQEAKPLRDGQRQEQHDQQLSPE